MYVEAMGYAKVGNVFWPDKKQAPDKYIRLCLSGVSKDDIDKISTLILAINELAINNR